MSRANPESRGVAAKAAARHSSEYLDYLRVRRRKQWVVHGCQTLLVVAFFAVWEVLARTHVVNPFLTSYPSAIWPTFVELLRDNHLLLNTWSTVWAMLVGFSVSMLLALLIAAALWWSEFIYRVFDPFVAVANAMPKIALVPIFYIWLGADYSIYGIAIAVALFVSVIMIYSGFRAVDGNRIKMARTFGATRWQLLRHIVLPGSVPAIFSTVKTNIGLSLIGVIVGEFQSANRGLGFLIINGSQVFKLNVVMTAVVILGVIAGIAYLLVARIEARVARRYR